MRFANQLHLRNRKGLELLNRIDTCVRHTSQHILLGEAGCDKRVTQRLRRLGILGTFFPLAAAVAFVAAILTRDACDDGGPLDDFDSAQLTATLSVIAAAVALAAATISVIAAAIALAAVGGACPAVYDRRWPEACGRSRPW